MRETGLVDQHNWKMPIDLACNSWAQGFGLVFVLAPYIPCIPCTMIWWKMICHLSRKVTQVLQMTGWNKRPCHQIEPRFYNFDVTFHQDFFLLPHVSTVKRILAIYCSLCRRLILLCIKKGHDDSWNENSVFNQLYFFIVQHVNPQRFHLLQDAGGRARGATWCRCLVAKRPLAWHRMRWQHIQNIAGYVYAVHI